MSEILSLTGIALESETLYIQTGMPISTVRINFTEQKLI